MPKRAPIKPAPAAIRVGWLEHVDLPELGLTGEKAKIDTGARTSSLHVDRIAPYIDAQGQHRARITKYVRHPGERHKTMHWDVEIRDFRSVKSSNGAVEERAVIVTMLKLGTITRRREFTLTNRKEMRYQILVGRMGLGKLFLVDPSAKFLLDQPPAPAKDPSA